MTDDAIKIPKATLKWIGAVVIAFLIGIAFGIVIMRVGSSGYAGAQQPAAQPSTDWSFVETDPAIGPKDAKVTVIEFADFQCPYCGVEYGRNAQEVGFSQAQATQLEPIKGAATKITNEYAKAGKVRFVYHTMAFLGTESVDAANAAFCAREIGGDEAFFKMHDKLFDKQNGENQGTFSKANLKEYAAEAGFNTTTMTNCIDSGKYNSIIQQSTTEANGVGVQGTPTLALNNAILPNGAVYTTLKSAIDAALAK